MNYGYEAKLGLEKTSFTPRLVLTTKSFFEKNPHYAINSTNQHFGSQKWMSQVCQTLFFEAKLEPEIVLYNAMLQGYLRKNTKFEYDNVTDTGAEKDIPVINNIKRIVGRFSFGFGFRNYNSTLLFEYYLQTPEYDYSWKDKYFHKYGRISFTMNI